MKPLYDDQIHTPAFQKVCDYFWSDDVDRAKKSGVWDYYVNVSGEFNKPLVNQSNIPQSGVIFVGMCHLLENIFQVLPKNGNYIIVHRTNDRPFTQFIYSQKPPSVKHIYTVDCQVHANDVAAIPFGNASIMGEDNLVKQIAAEVVSPAKTKMFVRFNINHDGSTQHRMHALRTLRQNDFALIIREQIPGDEFYRQVKAHKFTLALAGCGADASRQWAAIQLGSIPIVTDCPEMRHFEDLPMVYCPKKMEDLTEEWLDKQSVEGKSTGRMRMSYWTNHLQQKRIEHGIN